MVPNWFRDCGWDIDLREVVAVQTYNTGSIVVHMRGGTAITLIAIAAKEFLTNWDLWLAEQKVKHG